MSNPSVPLEEAAKQLGISTDQLMAMRSAGTIRAFKDGVSWKFPQSELDQLLAAGEGSEPAEDEDMDLSLDLNLNDDALSDAGDIELSLTEKALSDPSEIDLAAPEPLSGGSDLNLAAEEPSDLGSDLNLAAGGSAILDGSDPSPSVSGLGDDDDDDLVISDNEDDLLLDSAGSDISVIGGSGINLMSPSDSGLSLESEPLDLAGSSISALDLGGDSPSDAVPGSGASRSGSSGSLVDFKADEEFQLSPSGIGLEADDDSASQVIEVEDSQALSGAMGFDDAQAWDQRDDAMVDDVQGMEEADVVEESMEGDSIVVTKTTAQPVVPGAAGYEVPFSVWNVLSLCGILAMLTAGGVISADLMRNIWTDAGTSAPVSSLTQAVLQALGMDA